MKNKRLFIIVLLCIISFGLIGCSNEANCKTVTGVVIDTHIRPDGFTSDYSYMKLQTEGGEIKLKCNNNDIDAITIGTKINVTYNSDYRIDDITFIN